MKNEIELDENLWFTYKCCNEKHYLVGNSRFFHGKVYAWCPQKKQSIFVSISEIERISQYCKYWINGYLSGSCPSYIVDSNGEVDLEGTEYKKWTEFI